MAAVMALAAALLITPTYRLWKEQKEEAALSIS
jgi:hypothetical protein